MELGDYLATRRLSLAAFAREVGGVTRSAVHKYVHGDRFPEASVAARIEEVTEGEVTASDMLATWRRAQQGVPRTQRKRGRMPAQAAATARASA